MTENYLLSLDFSERVELEEIRFRYSHAMDNRHCSAKAKASTPQAETASSVATGGYHAEARNAVMFDKLTAPTREAGRE